MAGEWGCGTVVLEGGSESWVHATLLGPCGWASSPAYDVRMAMTSALSRTVGQQDVLVKAVPRCKRAWVQVLALPLICYMTCGAQFSLL